MSRWPDEPTPLDDEGDEDLDGQWELDPNDPSHPDYDLSLAHGYTDWEPAHKPLLARRGVIIVLTVLVIIGLFIPVLARLT